MGLKKSISIGLLLCAPVCGAESLLSQIYPADKPQPDYFRIVIDGALVPILKRPTYMEDGGRYLDFDLSDLPPGEHSYEIHACNPGGCAGPAEQIFQVFPPETPVIRKE